MPLRIGFDMDGVLADFASAFHDVEVRLFGPSSHMRAGEPEQEDEEPTPAEPADVAKTPARDNRKKDRRQADKDAAREARDSGRRRDLVWAAIRSTPDFWTTLRPLDERAVTRIHALMLEHRWEVFFITQRPKTDGDTVQRQTQRWLVEHGFDLPSVLVIGGSRGAAAGALRLDYHVDDSPQNCLDVVSDSRAKTILVVPEADEKTMASARKLGVATAPSIGAALDILEQASTARAQPGLLTRLATMVGWK
jgi:phosphoglycolate phosphatase-like HAD superfamily hydrolase